ncbi:MAG: tRNA pseudouridine(13) synthase TruD [Phycisphaerales bacterium]|nr:MAG: tRNA pseudouridine(13) synthase TruD [Phycisphaerales bacterium]
MSERDDVAFPGADARYLTADAAPVGGRLRERPEDFLVEEQPLYEPCGEGEHVYLFVQKRDIATSEVAALLAKHFRVRPRDVGYAGMKDKVAITRQLFSVHVPGKRPEDFPPFEHERAQALWVDLHTNKLRVGHLRGNRFSVRIRGTDMSRALHAANALRTLERLGAPNFAGEQRFGARQNNHLLGALDLAGDAQRLLDELLGPDERHPDMNAAARDAYTRGDYAAAADLHPRTARAERAALLALARGSSPERAVRAVDDTQRRFWISAFQSAVFNRLLRERIEAGALGDLEEGDLAWKHDNGAVFMVRPETLDEPDLRERLDSLAISPSGPLWGPEMTRAEGAAGEREAAALAATGVTLDMMRVFGERSRQRIAGARRPMRVPVIDPDVEGGVDEHGHYVRCAFELPAGAFATVVLREVMKPDI